MSTSSGGDVIVLGAGWVGSRLAARLIDRGHGVRVTNRPPSSVRRKEPYFQPVHLPDIPAYEFDMCESDTWANLPPPDELNAAVVTFSMQPSDCDAFWEQYLQHVPYVLCYSSTAVYRVDSPGQMVDEQTPLKESPRASAEAFLQSRGATVLTISGIFGEPREARGVCTCLAAYASSGGALNGRKSVNMVHVGDIIDATVNCLESRRHRGTRINVGGHHFLLRELISHCKYPPIPEEPDTDLSSKRVSSDLLLEDVLPDGYTFTEPFSVRGG